jgi:hypothetical protein
MFLPEGPGAAGQQEKADRDAGCSRVEAWSLALIPEDIRSGAIVSVQEVECQDPSCGPIDTAVTVVFQSGGSGIASIPAKAKDIDEKHLREKFPNHGVLTKWSRGEDTDWPPLDDDVEADITFPQLRFGHGSRVECRIGPDPVTGWARGTIVELWYREKSWPPGSFAPYQVELDDGRRIFAPADVDQVIRTAS